jgi:hypothetical protein
VSSCPEIREAKFNYGFPRSSLVGLTSDLRSTSDLPSAVRKEVQIHIPVAVLQGQKFNFFLLAVPRSKYDHLSIAAQIIRDCFTIRSKL